MKAIAEEIGIEQINHVIKQFYAQVRLHDTLKQPFAHIHNWTTHEEILSHFWWVSLGGKRFLNYNYDVAHKHYLSGFTPELLDDWKALFTQVIHQALTNKEHIDGWLERVNLISVSLVRVNKMMEQFQGHRPVHDEDVFRHKA